MKRYGHLSLITILGILGLALVFGFTGCDPNGDDDDDQPGNDRPATGLNLPAIDEPTTGLSTVTVTDYDLGDEWNDTSISDNTYITVSKAGSPSESVGTWSVTAGKLALEITEAPSADATIGVADLNGVNVDEYGSIFGRTDAGYELTIDPTDSAARFGIASFGYFDINDQSTRYDLDRSARVSDETTYSDSSVIDYVYVSADVTITRAEKAWTETYTEGTYNMTYAAINLPLKAGWNLVQRDTYMTSNSETITIKIADKNVPWELVDESDEEE